MADLNQQDRAEQDEIRAAYEAEFPLAKGQWDSEVGGYEDERHTYALAGFRAAFQAARRQHGSAAQCNHRIVDARNPVVTSGYMCIEEGCGAVFAAGDHGGSAAQAAAPVAWLYSDNSGLGPVLRTERLGEISREWTETPLFAAPPVADTEGLANIAAFPLESFAYESKPDSYKLWGADDWALTVGDIRKARAALSRLNGESK